MSEAATTGSAFVQSWTPGPTVAPTFSTSAPVPFSTRFEKVTLFLLAAWIPLDERYAFFSTGYGTALLALLALALVLRRSTPLVRAVASPRMVPLYLFLVATLATELFQPFAALSWWPRLAQMVAAITIVAASCRDRGTVRVALTGVVVGGVAMSTLFLLSSWTDFASVGVVDYNTTQEVGAAAKSNSLLGDGSYNLPAFYAAAASSVAAAIAVADKRRKVRLAFVVAAAYCAAGVAISTSRGALATAAIAMLLGVVSYGKGRVKRLALVAAIGIALLAVIPTSAFGRVLSSKEDSIGKEDPRTLLWQAVGDNLGEEIPIGVGDGNFFAGWGAEHGFQVHGTSVSGTHSSLSQVLVFWGVAPLVFLLWFVVALLVRLLRSPIETFAKLPVLVLVIALCTDLLFSHGLHGKQYSLGFGLALSLLLWRVRPAQDNMRAAGGMARKVALP